MAYLQGCADEAGLGSRFRWTMVPGDWRSDLKTLSKKAKYALRALYHLTREHGRGPVLIATLAQEETIPHKFLELILLHLKNNRLVESKKGRNGGYFLAKDPNQITGRVRDPLDRRSSRSSSVRE